MMADSYHFNQEGTLVNDKTGKGFVFKVKSSDKDNQERYERIGETVVGLVYEHMESKAGLSKQDVPVDKKSSECGTFIFATPDFQTCDKLLVLINGCGAVKAGQWSRSLIMNKGLDQGSQLPFIEEGKTAKYGVVVMNANDNMRCGQKIKGSESDVDHVKYVWKNYILQSRAAYIAIIAHSAGGYFTTTLINSFPDDFKKRMFALAFTDSVHRISQIAQPMRSYFKQVAKNWASSQLYSKQAEDCSVKIVQTPKLETVWKYRIEMFSYIADMLKKRTDLNSSMASLSLSDDEPLMRDAVLQNVDPKMQQLYKQPGKEVYKMTSPVRGRVLILNQSCDREGSDYDVINLERVWKELHFDVVVKPDVQSFAECIKAETANPLHTKYGMSVFILMSHGNDAKEQHVIFNGKGEAEVVEELMDLLKPDKFPNMLNKPKILLINSCAGGKRDNGLLSDFSTDSCLPIFRKTRVRSATHQDILLATSSYKGHVSYRSSSKGALFIRAFVKQVATYARTYHMLEILTKVTEMVTAENVPCDDGSLAVQCPPVLSTLTKKIYLFPGMNNSLN